jgi:hypothetical protein
MIRIIFYSKKCEYCNKLLDYLNKYKLNNLFKLIDIDTLKNIPNYIDSVPTLIDNDLNQPLKNKQVFEYLINIKYFNNPTNNIELINNIPDNPKIIHDNKAYDNITNNLEINETSLFYSKNKDNNDITKEMIKDRNKQITNLSVLLKKQIKN